MGYSNSSLVSYTKLSPNYESRGGKTIKYLLIHCMAGNCSVETCGDIFASPSRGASSNYGIGSDGRIAMYVPECYRAWCTGGTKNIHGITGADLDYEGVSIEVANDTGDPDWHITDAAMDSLVNLCADICRRNNISSLRWEANPDLVGNPDAQNIAVHRWMAYKACLPTNRTELLTKHGWIKLKDVKIGDEIATAHLADFKITFSPVLDVIPTKIQDTYSINDLEATADHRIAYNDGNNNLNVGYYHDVFDKPFKLVNAGHYNGEGLSLSNDEIKELISNNKLDWNLIEMNSAQAKYFLDEISKSSIEINGKNLDIIMAIGALNEITILFDESSKSIIIDKNNMRVCNGLDHITSCAQEVSCVTVDSGFILIRQNKRTTIVGNCPGNYIYDHLGEMADRVNAILDQDNADEVIADVEVPSNPDQIMWDFLASKDLNAYAIAGIMGNIFAESGLISINLQNSYEKKLGYTDESYTAAVDNGSYENFVHDSAGYGLCQWTYWSRKQGLLDYSNEKGVSIGDFNMQLEYFWKELQGYPNVLEVLNSATSIREASDVILTDFERPADQSEAVKVKRASYGQTYYDRFGNTSDSPSYDVDDSELVTEFPELPFVVKVLIDDLNIRSEASMDGVVKGQTSKGVFTITEISDGWGKLKSGAGWIYLENPNYVEVLNSIAIPAEPEADEEPPRFPYTVKVDIDDLNIRTGAGTDFDINGQTGKGVFTIVDECVGEGASLWLKLKSGAGWISQDFTTRIE